MRLRAVIAALMFLAATECQASRTVEGVVRGVSDGDTILLVTRNATRIDIRLYGVDAPETARYGKPGQPFGEESRRELRSRIMGKTVSAEIVETDRFRRSVAVIRCGGQDINRGMVADGMAWAYRQYLRRPYAAAYIEAEGHARARRAGLWRDNNPLPPWEFRQLHSGGTRRHRYRR